MLTLLYMSPNTSKAHEMSEYILLKNICLKHSYETNESVCLHDGPKNVEHFQKRI